MTLYRASGEFFYVCEDSVSDSWQKIISAGINNLSNRDVRDQIRQSAQLVLVERQPPAKCRYNPAAHQGCDSFRFRQGGDDDRIVWIIRLPTLRYIDTLQGTSLKTETAKTQITNWYKFFWVSYPHILI